MNIFFKKKLCLISPNLMVVYFKVENVYDFCSENFYLISPPWRSVILSFLMEYLNKNKRWKSQPKIVPLHLIVRQKLVEPSVPLLLRSLNFPGKTTPFFLVKDIAGSLEALDGHYSTIFKENIVSGKPLKESWNSSYPLLCFDWLRLGESNII